MGLAYLFTLNPVQPPQLIGKSASPMCRVCDCSSGCNFTLLARLSRGNCPNQSTMSLTPRYLKSADLLLIVFDEPSGVNVDVDSLCSSKVHEPPLSIPFLLFGRVLEAHTFGCRILGRPEQPTETGYTGSSYPDNTGDLQPSQLRHPVHTGVQSKGMLDSTDSGLAGLWKIIHIRPARADGWQVLELHWRTLHLRRGQACRGRAHTVFWRGAPCVEAAAVAETNRRTLSKRRSTYPSLRLPWSLFPT